MAGYPSDVFLTFIGGGVFGNDKQWIAAAIGRALAVAAQSLQLLQQQQHRGNYEIMDKCSFISYLF